MPKANRILDEAISLSENIQKKRPSLTLVERPADLEDIFAANSYDLKRASLPRGMEGILIHGQGIDETYLAIRLTSSIKIFFSLIGSFITFLSVCIASLYLTVSFFSESAIIGATLLFGGFIGATFSAAIVKKKTYPRRETFLYKENYQPEKQILKVSSLAKLSPLKKVYILNDTFGETVIKMEKSFFQMNWTIFDQNNNLLFKARESSILRFLLRKTLIFKRFVPVEYLFEKDGEIVFGSFNRESKRYNLDYDREAIGPWLALGVTLLLDTAEK